MGWIQDLAKSFLAEKSKIGSGAGSSARVLSAIIVLSALGWIWYVLARVLHTSADLINVATFMGSVAVFVASTVGVLYGINKISSSVSDTLTSINSLAPTNVNINQNQNSGGH